MGRIALTLYLSLTVSFGPALCCCTAPQLFPFACKAGSCCAKEADHASHSHAAHSHHHHDGHSHAEHSVALNKAKPEHQAPCDHNQKDCPCGRHQLTMFAAQSDGDLSLKSIAHGHAFWLIAIDISMSHLPEIEVNSLLAATHHRYGDLSSREILRAHNRLQC